MKKKSKASQDVPKDCVLQVRLDEVLLYAARNAVLKDGFDSIQQVIRIFLAAYADNRVKPEFFIDLAVRKGKDSVKGLDKTELEMARKRYEFAEKQKRESLEYDKEIAREMAELRAERGY